MIPKRLSDVLIVITKTGILIDFCHVTLIMEYFCNVQNYRIQVI
jgi:hypothetical protein